MNALHDIIQAILNNTHIIGVLALSTMGITLTYKTANAANFSQYITSTIGAYMAGWLVRETGANPWVAMIVGVALCFLVGVAMDSGIIRYIGVGSRAMVTIALIVIFTAGIPMVFGTIPYNFPRFFKDQINFKLFGMDFNVTQNAVFILILAAVVIAIIFLALNLTKWGLGVRGTASNLYVAGMMGVNTNMMTSLSWGISTACGGLAAILLASQTQAISLAMMASTNANSLLAFVVGGYTSFYGPIVGALIIPVVHSLMAFISGIWAGALLYILVLLLILFKPNGLFGKATQKKV